MTDYTTLNDKTTQVLKVTADGEFIWHKDADRLIEEGDYTGIPAMKHILKALRQALEQSERVSVPEGWKLVPIEPTDAMLSVPVNIDLRECVTPGGVTGLDAVGLFNAWEAMIEAAPQPWDTTDMAYRQGGLSMEQEPVAFVCRGKFSTIEHCEECEPLYAAPPKREWVGLTDEELISVYESEQAGRWGDHIRSLRAVEAKLKEKNK